MVLRIVLGGRGQSKIESSFFCFCFFRFIKTKPANSRIAINAASIVSKYHDRIKGANLQTYNAKSDPDCRPLIVLRWRNLTRLLI